jgi:hypothetical protein
MYLLEFQDDLGLLPAPLAHGLLLDAIVAVSHDGDEQVQHNHRLHSYNQSINQSIT